MVLQPVLVDSIEPPLPHVKRPGSGSLGVPVTGEELACARGTHVPAPSSLSSMFGGDATSLSRELGAGPQDLLILLFQPDLGREVRETVGRPAFEGLRSHLGRFCACTTA